MGQKLEWAGRPSHLGGIPRKMVFMAVGTFAKVVATLLNSTYVHNADTLIRMVRSRPSGVPLITVSNHMSTLVTLFIPPWPFLLPITLSLLINTLQMRALFQSTMPN